MQRNRQSGFTLIEIMVVLVIIGVMAALVVPNILGRPDEARATIAAADIRAIESALEIYRLDNHNYPSTDQGLEALVKKPLGTPEPADWKSEGYLRKLPQDPWGNPYQYLSPGIHGAYDLYSLGADGKIGGEQKNSDITNWQ